MRATCLFLVEASETFHSEGHDTTPLTLTTVKMSTAVSVTRFPSGLLSLCHAAVWRWYCHCICMYACRLVNDKSGQNVKTTLSHVSYRQWWIRCAKKSVAVSTSGRASVELNFYSVDNVDRRASIIGQCNMLSSSPLHLNHLSSQSATSSSHATLLSISFELQFCHHYRHFTDQHQLSWLYLFVLLAPLCFNYYDISNSAMEERPRDESAI